MKKVLIISYFFPPDPSIGSLRIKGLFDYLPEFGWKPIVLTKRIPMDSNSDNVLLTPYSEHNSIYELMKKIGLDPKKEVRGQIGQTPKIKKVDIMDKLLMLGFEIISYPDPQKDWRKYAFEKADSFLKYEKIDAIISSSLPLTCHLVAYDLKKKYGIPWIADFRDLWSQNHYGNHTKIFKLRAEKLEKKTLSIADALTTVSTPLAEKLIAIHNLKGIFSITNGFDPKKISRNSQRLSKKFTITYTGSLYFKKRDPTKLFEAISELITEKQVLLEDLEIKFYGQKESWIDTDISRYGLNSIVTQNGTLSRDIIFEIQKESQLLLILLWDHPEEKGVYTGKLFEYLVAQRPILAIGGSERGVVSELLEETRAGFYSSSVEETKLIIKKCYDEYLSNGKISYRGNLQKINLYSQREMAKKFALILDSLITKM